MQDKGDNHNGNVRNFKLVPDLWENCESWENTVNYKYADHGGFWPITFIELQIGQLLFKPLL